MKLKTKLSIAGAVLLIIALATSHTAIYYMGWMAHSRSIEPPEGYSGSVTTTYTHQSDPENTGKITIDRWVFDSRFGQFYAASSGGSCEALVTFPRPPQWIPPAPIRHFIGVGIDLHEANSEIMYGGYLSYRYMIMPRLSVRAAFSLAMNQKLKHDIGFQAGVEAGIK